MKKSMAIESCLTGKYYTRVEDHNVLLNKSDLNGVAWCFCYEDAVQTAKTECSASKQTVRRLYVINNGECDTPRAFFTFAHAWDGKHLNLRKWQLETMEWVYNDRKRFRFHMNTKKGQKWLKMSKIMTKAVNATMQVHDVHRGANV